MPNKQVVDLGHGWLAIERDGGSLLISHRTEDRHIDLPKESVDLLRQILQGAKQMRHNNPAQRVVADAWAEFGAACSEEDLRVSVAFILDKIADLTSAGPLQGHLRQLAGDLK